MPSLRVVILIALLAITAAFQMPIKTTRATTPSLSLFKKDDDEDLSFLEVRDMTPEEMKRYNARSEKIMNNELIGMTLFSLIISLPLLYLAWVGCPSDTAEIAGDLSPY